MTIKSRGRSLGRIIRRLSGLPLPIAMKLGKMVAQEKTESEMAEKFPDFFSMRTYRCGDGCCVYPIYTLKGKRGPFDFEYSFGEGIIQKEYEISQKLSCVPLGTTVSFS